MIVNEVLMSYFSGR